MTTYPLETLAWQITPTGATAPSYADVIASLTATIQGAQGSDIVLDNSSQDFQIVAVVARAINDSNLSGIDSYNAQSPQYAQGAGLSSRVKINGLRRKVSSPSTAPIQCGGPAGTVIASGVVSDGTYKWDLPTTVTIPIGGSIVVTATCETQGAILAPAGTINQIVNPQKDWQTAVSTGDAAPGAPVQTDAQLRVLQAKSTTLPSQSILAGIVAAVANVPGVTQVAPYENTTATVDANGAPAGSFYLVVEGGDATAVATAMASKMSPGSITYGTTSIVVTDPNTGVPTRVNFFIPTLVPINIGVTLVPQTGYVSSTGALIVTQETGYIDAMPIEGTDGFVFLSKLYSPANDTGAMANTYNVTGIQASRGTGTSLGGTDIPIAFNEIPYPGTIAVTVA